MASFESFSKAFHEHALRDPNHCVQLGVDVRLDELPDPSAEAHQLEVDSANALLKFGRGFSRAGLNFDQALDVDLACLELERQVFTGTLCYNGRLDHAQNPRAADAIGDGIFQIFINDPRPDSERIENVTARMERVPQYLASLTQSLSVPVKRWAQMDMEKVSGLSTLFDAITEWAAKTEGADCARLGQARTGAEEALSDYSKSLAKLPTTEQFSIGRDDAAELIRLRGVELSLGELHSMATEFLSEVSDTVESLRGKLASRYGLASSASVSEVQRALKERFCLQLGDQGMDGVLSRYQAERRNVLKFIQERRLFPIPDQQDMLILKTPRFMEPSIPAGAMLSPAPFRSGVKRSLIYLTLSESLLPEHTELSIPGMMVHEGIPGHHLQLATAAGHPSVIRRHMDAMDLCEGWTTMLEDYMLDIGYMGELTDEARFIGKLDGARIGARVAIDLFFMTGDAEFLNVGVDCDTSSPDPFEAAGALLSAVTGFVPGRVQAELNWYSQERGYPLSYLTGNRLVWQLKRDFQESQRGSDALDIDRKFHQTFLEAGNMPMAYLKRVFQHQGLAGN